MYSESRAILEKIADVMSVQTTPTYKAAFAWLKDFHDNLKHGNVPACMPPAEDAGASQFTIATPPHMPSTSVSPAPDVSTTSVTVTPVTPGSEDVSMSPVEEEYEDKASVAAPMQAKGLRSQNRVKNLRKARDLARQIRQGKTHRVVEVNDVEALLDGPYSMDTAKDVLAKFNPPVVSPTQAEDVRNFNVGQQLPQFKAMLPLDTVQSATRAIHDKNSAHDLLAYWPDFGYATLEYLELMERIINAKNQLRDAALTLVWIDRVEWCASDVSTPFDDARWLTKAEHKGVIMDMNLSTTLVSANATPGSLLLHFRERLWLNTTCMVAGMQFMKEVYVRSKVGIVNPSYHAYSSLAKKREVAAGYGAADPNNECVIGVLNLSEVHWVAFHLDKTTQVCKLIDPQQSSITFTTLKKSIQFTVEPMLSMQSEIEYEEVRWCNQQDANSCGVWCLVVLELLLSKNEWDDSLYKLLPFLRMRYLNKCANLLRHVSINDDDE
ncbi:hypothetical protein BBJ28_00002283 [Nothophytophthora sp. Chile5]|nr:hypothetical protein BBJ28_00002283 [Nothophytophthora sp. Chile5]